METPLFSACKQHLEVITNLFGVSCAVLSRCSFGLSCGFPRTFFFVERRHSTRTGSNNLAEETQETVSLGMVKFTGFCGTEEIFGPMPPDINICIVDCGADIQGVAKVGTFSHTWITIGQRPK